MHQFKVLVYGPISFINTLNELKTFLKFNYLTGSSESKCDIILFHDKILTDKQTEEIINKSNALKVCVSSKRIERTKWDAIIQLPTTIKEINSVLEETTIKKKFLDNSSIKVKKYYLNKNEKKLSKNGNSIILTEKEIQLIELFLDNTKPISKDKILSSVWNYSVDADTHTVETHIYRLRKKINKKFMDDSFISNNKDGYFL